VVNAVSGMKVGAVVGFLLWATADFSLYGITNMSNLTWSRRSAARSLGATVTT
jgi:hypothetical protein